MVNKLAAYAHKYGETDTAALIQRIVGDDCLTKHAGIGTFLKNMFAKPKAPLSKETEATARELKTKFEQLRKLHLGEPYVQSPPREHMRDMLSLSEALGDIHHKMQNYEDQISRNKSTFTNRFKYWGDNSPIPPAEGIRDLSKQQLTYHAAHPGDFSKGDVTSRKHTVSQEEAIKRLADLSIKDTLNQATFHAKDKDKYFDLLASYENPEANKAMIDGMRQDYFDKINAGAKPHFYMPETGGARQPVLMPYAFGEKSVKFDTNKMFGVADGDISAMRRKLNSAIEQDPSGHAREFAYHFEQPLLSKGYLEYADIDNPAKLKSILQNPLLSGNAMNPQDIDRIVAHVNKKDSGGFQQALQDTVAEAASAQHPDAEMRDIFARVSDRIKHRRMEPEQYADMLRAIKAAPRRSAKEKIDWATDVGSAGLVGGMATGALALPAYLHYNKRREEDAQQPTRSPDSL